MEKAEAKMFFQTEKEFANYDYFVIACLLDFFDGKNDIGFEVYRKLDKVKSIRVLRRMKKIRAEYEKLKNNPDLTKNSPLLYDRNYTVERRRFLIPCHLNLGYQYIWGVQKQSPMKHRPTFNRDWLASTYSPKERLEIESKYLKTFFKFFKGVNP